MSTSGDDRCRNDRGTEQPAGVSPTGTGPQPAKDVLPDAPAACLARLEAAAVDLEHRNTELQQELDQRSAFALALRTRLHNERKLRLHAERSCEELARTQGGYHSLLPLPGTGLPPASSPAAATAGEGPGTSSLASGSRELPDAEDLPLVNLTELVNALEEELLPLRRVQHQLEHECRQYRADLAATRTRLEHTLNDLATLREQQAAFELAQSERAALIEHLRRIEAEGRRIPGLLAQLRELDDECRQIPVLRKQAHDLEARVREIPALREVIEHQRQELARVPELVATIRRLETETRELSLVKARATRLETRARQVPILTQRAQELEEAAAEAARQSELLSDQLQQSEAELDEWRRCLRSPGLPPYDRPAQVAEQLRSIELLEARLAELELSLSRAESSRGEAQLRAEAIAHSTVWRLTAPARRLLDLIRRR